jgi:hypothetical protein
VDANLVSISLDPLGVSGAQLLSDDRVEFQTIKAGESATAKFTLQSQRTFRRASGQACALCFPPIAL